MCAFCGLSVKPLPRWVLLPDDPAPLRLWLRAKQAEHPETYGGELSEPPPEEEP